MHALIDLSVPFADKFYMTYLAEPSPAGDISLAVDDITTVDHMTLDKLLSEMKGVGQGGEMFVATHSSPEGFLMAMMAGSKVTLKFSVMEKILKIAEGARRREAIKSLPSSQVPEAWRKWYQDFFPGYKLEPGYETANSDWKDQVEKEYETYLEVQGTTVLGLPKGARDLKVLLDLLADVRSLGFKRIEFRACEIGADKDAMKNVATFLNAKTVVGPKKVQTFYGAFQPKQINLVPDSKRLAFELKKMGGRTFGASLGMLMLPHGIKVLAKDQDALKAFVVKFISAGFKGSIVPFVVGGLDSIGTTTTKYVFPLETEYKSLIDRFDA